MSMALIRKEFRENRWKLILGLIVLTVMGISLPLMYEVILDFFSDIRVDLGWVDRLIPAHLMGSFSAFLWSQWHAKNLYQIGTLFAVLLGMNTVAGEVGSQTMGFLLTRPISRRAVFLAKVTAGTLILIIVVAFSTAAMIVSAVLTGQEAIEVGRLVFTTMITGLGLVTIYMLTACVSTVMNDPVKVGGVALLFLFFMSVLGWFNATHSFSIYSHIAGGEYFLSGIFPVGPVVAMLVAIGIFLWAGITVLERKEF